MRPIQQLLYFLSIVTLVAFLTFVFTDSPRAVASRLTTGFARPSSPPAYKPARHNETGHAQRRAYATFLSTRTGPESSDEDDPYFTAVRVLAYQILHHPETRTNLDVPFLVLVTPNISKAKRLRLEADGATIVPVDRLEPEKHWAVPGDPKWVDQFSKLRLFELTQFDRILYMDGDMLLTRSMDGIWEEDVARDVQWTRKDSEQVRHDEAPLPDQYLFAGVSDTGGAHHAFPPVEEKDDLNGGFFLLRPDNALFGYYRSLVDIPRRFDAHYMEQALLTYAHRQSGNMPWQRIPAGKWNANWPGLQDLKGGAASLHDKFWEPGNEDWMDRKLVEMWWRVQGEMEGYWRRVEEEERGGSR